MSSLPRHFAFTLFATAVLALPQHGHAAGFQVLHRFTGGSDGEYPESGFAIDQNGNLYGTTFGELGGGTTTPGKHCPKSCGTTFELVLANRVPSKASINTLYQFQSSGQLDGEFPTAELLPVSDGQGNTILYGTTKFGPGTGCGGLGCGTVFRLPATGGSDTVLFKFCNKPLCADGAIPEAGLVADEAGTLYGVTTSGGTADGGRCYNDLGGCGTIFSLTPASTKPNVLHSFCAEAQDTSCASGAVPVGKLLSLNGSLYGTTEFGGAFGEGTIFQISADGSGYKVLYSFCQQSNCADGAVPEAGLIADRAGNLYGTSTYGGTVCDGNATGCGVVFKLAPPYTAATYRMLYAFRGKSPGRPDTTSDGALPQAMLVRHRGVLYGTTLRGGTGPCGLKAGCGTIFALMRQGGAYVEQVLYRFCPNGVPCTDGDHPEGALVFHHHHLYGMTRTGGQRSANGNPGCLCGTVFRLRIAKAANPLPVPTQKSELAALKEGRPVRPAQH
ncbi:MAG TPA: choice-of-anchor tandem repeat GloVer-containing protein [Acidobacteriaceae bacterium]|nr:choice-of-anchor tandem repeat GloVer-containing protein [Acidobacteriaceae bacterium]